MRTARRLMLTMAATTLTLTALTVPAHATGPTDPVIKLVDQILSETLGKTNGVIPASTNAGG